MDAIGIIPARYDSHRFPGKVLAEIAGKPMVIYVWEQVKRALLLDDVIIACDNKDVFAIVQDFGAKAIMTAKEHLSGTDRIAEVIAPIDVKVIVNIQADEPLIKPLMIDSLVETLLRDESVYMATLMRKIKDPKDISDPNVVKVVIDKNNFALYFSRAPIPYFASEVSIEDICYKHIGLYAYTKDFLFTYKNIPQSGLESIEKLEQLRVLEDGLKIKLIETEFDTIGVDTSEDLERVRQILADGNARDTAG